MLSRRANILARSTLRQQQQQQQLVLRQSLFKTSRGVRLNSTTASSSSTGSGSGSAAVTGAAAGAVSAVLVGYLLYRWSGAHRAVASVQAIQNQWDTATTKLKEKAPEPSEAIKWLKSMSEHYAGFIPGAKPLLDSAFDDLDKLQKDHSDEAQKIVTDTYNEIKKVLDKDGLTIGAAASAWSVLESKLGDIKKLANKAGQDIIGQHPELSKQIGGKFDDLRKLAESQGPEAKKQLDELYAQVKDITNKGLSADSISQISKLAQDKFDDLRKAGEQAYDKGIQQLGPLLDKSPEVKKFVEDNAKQLRSVQGLNVSELVNKVKDVVEQKSGAKLEDLQKYVDEAKKLASGNSSSSVSDYFEKLIPSGAGREIYNHFQNIQDVASKHGDEAKQLGQKTFDEIRQILEKRAQEAKTLAEKATKDATK
ncbi:hypothetical protein PYCC9005_002019 [Savitreella phatthalungensis]